jgi:hypothetical protein
MKESIEFYSFSCIRQQILASSLAGIFDGRVDALEQCTQHCPIQHIQGYTGSLWTPTLGDYLLHIAPAAARATGNKTMM